MRAYKRMQYYWPSSRWTSPDRIMALAMWGGAAGAVALFMIQPCEYEGVLPGILFVCVRERERERERERAGGGGAGCWAPQQSSALSVQCDLKPHAHVILL